MSRAFDDFLAGRGALTLLLRAVPPYEPPDVLARQFAVMARQIQDDHEARERTVLFEPPASLEASFLKEAASIQAAQQPRHDAVLQAIREGKSARAVLGHDVSEATTQWLESRPERVAAAQLRKPARKSARKPRSVWQIWAPRFAVFGVSVLAVGIGLQQWQSPEPTPTVLASGAIKSEAAPGQAAQLPAEQVAELARPAAPPPVMLESRQIASVVDATPDARAEKKTLAASPARMTAYEAARLAAQRDAELAASAETEQPAATVGMADRAAVLAATPPAAPAPASTEESRAFAAAAPMRESSVAEVMPAAKAAPAAAARAKGQAFETQLDNSPQLAARRWQLMGNTRAPRIAAAQPDAGNVRLWVEAFRLALPAAQRPPRLFVVEDATLPADALRIEAPPR